jgi:adenylate cyclase
VEAREIDRVAVLGQSRPQAVFEIMGRKGELSPAQLELRDRFSEGLACYRRRQWDESRRAFEAALAIVPNDGPSTTFINRLDELTLRPPGGDWDGSWRLAQK